MLKRKQVIVAAAAVAAAPLAAKAAINVAFGYDTTVTIATNATFTTGVTTTSIVGNAITVPAGDFFKFNVNADVTGNPNAASGGAFDTSNGTTQPANLGLAGFGFVFANNAGIAPVVTSAKSTVTFPAALKYDISGKGTANATNAGTAGAPLSAGYNPGQTTSTGGFYRLTLGAGAKADIFTGLTYQAGAGGTSSTITPTNPAGTIAYAFLQSAGNSTSFPTYTSDTVGTNTGDTLTALPTLTVTVPGVGNTTHNIISLTSATIPAGNYGVQLTSGTGANQATFAPNAPVAGTINVTKNGANSYTPGFANGVSGATAGTGAIADFAAISGFAAGDQEIYALKMLVGGTAPTTTQMNSIVADIGGQTGDGVSTVASLLGSPSGLAGQIAGIFPGYDLMLTVNAGSGSATPFLGFDFSQETNVGGVVVTNIAAIPEPATAAILLMGSSLLLGRRKRNALMA